jgi:2-amino-4-hydroxy-6-hydroxymethyldihydropteridine diphosphokinase
VRVAIALGSNLGDRRAHLQFAVEQLQARLNDLRASSIVETEPVDVDEPQPPYLNAVVVGNTDVPPEALLAELVQIESARGRRRPSRHAARTLDLDLIIYGDQVIDTPVLTVPHPRFRERMFVLAPLAELAGDWKDPVTGQSISALLAGLLVAGA